MDKKFMREIILVLLIKGIVIFGIWAFWFAHPEEETLDAAQVAAQIFSEHITKGGK